MAHNLILSAGLFQPCPGAVCGALHPLAWGAHPAEVPSGAHVPLCPQGAPGRVNARCQWLFPAGTMSRQAGACPAQGRGGVPAATMQQPLRKSRHMDALGCPFLLLLILSPTALLMRARVGGAALRGSCSSSPALPCKGVPVGMGGHSQPPVEGLSCRSRASIASSFGEPRHAKGETWPVCKQAPGPRGFLYKGCFSR